MTSATFCSWSRVVTFVVVQLIVIGVPFVAIEAFHPFHDQIVGSTVTTQ